MIERAVDGYHRSYMVPSVEDARQECEDAAQFGELTWADLALEKFSEIVYAPDDDTRRKELIRMSIMCTQWAENIVFRSLKGVE